jgi:RNA polymerase sigma-70 factor, ECF subfamily
VIVRGRAGHHPDVRGPSLALDVTPGMDLEERTERDARLAEMVDGHFELVWRLVRRLGVPASDADDAAQQVFMIATRRLQDIVPGRERTFLYGAAIRVAANARRGRRRRREEPEAPDDDRVDERPGPHETRQLGEARELLDRLLDRLPSPLRKVLVLAELEQLEVAEIAELEGIKLGTAASRLRRARAAFQEHLAAHPQDNPFREGES